MTQKKITLLWGLPGSGKSHYAREQCPPRTRDPYVVDVDTIFKYKSAHRSLADAVADDVVGRMHYVDHVIIDGFVVTNKVADDIFTAIVTHPGCENKYEILFCIVWWTPDVETCLWNDRGRRSVPSRISIQHTEFEEPSEQLIEAWNMKKRVTRKKVVAKPAWQVWAQENGAGSDPKMKGESWSLGGTAGNCWDSELRTVSAGVQPTSFREFDDLLEAICPQITFLQYKKLYNATVSSETKGEGDYYGGYVEYACYTCDLPMLYDMLKEMGVING